MAFDLERAGPAVANINDSRVFTGTLNYASDLVGSLLRCTLEDLSGAVLAPHDRIDAKFGERGSPSQRREDAVIFVWSDAVQS